MDVSGNLLSSNPPDCRGGTRESIWVARSRNGTGEGPRSGFVRACLAYLSARIQDKGRAESEIAQALQLSPNDGNTQWMAVATYEALGRRDQALAVLSTSSSQLIADLKRWPDMADLQRDFRFLELLKSRRIE